MSITKDQTQATYNNYRAALRSMPHTAGSRAGDRKQRALKLTADRYHTPISKVKEIVRQLEEENGIIHEQDPNYVAARQMQEAHEEATERMIAAQRTTAGDPNRAPSCETCGDDDERALVRVRLDELRYDLTGEKVFTLQCFKHWYVSSTSRGSSLTLQD
jgi:hypothetical protein